MSNRLNYSLVTSDKDKEDNYCSKRFIDIPSRINESNINTSFIKRLNDNFKFPFINSVQSTIFGTNITFTWEAKYHYYIIINQIYPDTLTYGSDASLSSNIDTYSIIGLNGGNFYSFIFIPYDEFGKEGPAYDQVDIYMLGVNVTGGVTQSSILLSWDFGGLFDYVNINQAESSNEYNDITNTSLLIENLNTNTKYTFYVTPFSYTNGSSSTSIISLYT
jgi:formylmethanofuran dehydrogenase subunit B